MKYRLSNQRITRLLVLPLVTLGLTACDSLNLTPQDSNTELEVTELPQVQPKYDAETISDFNYRVGIGRSKRYEGLVISPKPILSTPDELPAALTYDTGISIPYPETGVRGVYLTVENVQNEEYFNYIIDYIDQTELNAVVIDFKTDWGYVANQEPSDNEMVNEKRLDLNMREVIERLQEHQIYPIARIVAFKDNLLADSTPRLSFFDNETGEVWEDGNGSKFINPFSRETWDYVMDIAEEAAQLGFQDIQFDYIRFPEGFHEFEPYLDYDIGEFSYFISDNPDESGYERVEAINAFLDYAQRRLQIYNVKISADVFGYTAIAGDVFDVRGIGQNFIEMSERIDTVSSMIYPSHWNPGFFGFDYPDIYPYEFTDTYMQEERYIMDNFIDNPVNSRPWLQDFTWYGAPGTYLEYGPAEVEAQIQALADNDVYEFLLWNASGEYTTGVDYYKGD